MQLVKLIIPKKINTLHGFHLALMILFFAGFSPVFSQDNSPYSRYGIGDLVPQSHITERAMGGISAGYADPFSINFVNPASYSSFMAGIEPKSKKMAFGRAILDIGVDLDSRTLREPATKKSFVASNALFSYVQVGLPIKDNWGLSFGLRPLSRISYNLFNTQILTDPSTGLPIDSATTRYVGSGGAYLASVGTGLSLFHRTTKNGEEKLSIGVNAGYLFGGKDYSTKRSIINDTVNYYQSNYETKTTFGSLYFNGGLQFKVPLNKKMLLTIGADGSLSQKLNATQDKLRETFVFDTNLGDVRLDSIADLRNVKGKIILPATYTVGFILQKLQVINKEGGWLLGVDFMQQNWSQYRIYGQSDSVQNTWQLRVGGQLNPIPKRNYFSQVAYRAGFFTGPDYIKVGQKMSVMGASFGMGLPVALSRQAPYQVTIVNVAIEYSKRGNNNNILKESMFRFSVGFSLSDAWFIKKKYD